LSRSGGCPVGVVTIMLLLVLHWRGVGTPAVQPAGVVPIDPLGQGELDVSQVAPGSLPADELGLEQVEHRFGGRIVEGVARRADAADEPGLGEALGVADRQALTGPAMAHVFAAGRLPEASATPGGRARTTARLTCDACRITGRWSVPRRPLGLSDERTGSAVATDQVGAIVGQAKADALARARERVRAPAEGALTSGGTCSNRTPPLAAASVP